MTEWVKRRAIVLLILAAERELQSIAAGTRPCSLFTVQSGEASDTHSPSLRRLHVAEVLGGIMGCTGCTGWCRTRTGRTRTKTKTRTRTRTTRPSLPACACVQSSFMDATHAFALHAAGSVLPRQSCPRWRRSRRSAPEQTNQSAGTVSAEPIAAVCRRLRAPPPLLASKAHLPSIALAFASPAAALS